MRAPDALASAVAVSGGGGGGGFAVRMSSLPVSQPAAPRVVRPRVVTTLRQASILHREKNETEKAFRLVRALHQRFQRSTDASLKKEKALVAKLDETLTRLSGHQGEAPKPQPRSRHMISGLPGH